MPFPEKTVISSGLKVRMELNCTDCNFVMMRMFATPSVAVKITGSMETECPKCGKRVSTGVEGKETIRG